MADKLTEEIVSLLILSKFRTNFPALYQSTDMTEI